MFSGENLATIDAKGRSSIPVKFRDILVQDFGDERFVITKGTPVDVEEGGSVHGLSAFPFREWQEIEKAINENRHGVTASQLNSMKRHFLAPSVVCTADKQGRVLIPPTLRGWAGLERDIWVVGMGNKFDIWSDPAYHRVTRQDEANLPKDSEAFAALGL